LFTFILIITGFIPGILFYIIVALIIPKKTISPDIPLPLESKEL